MENKFNFTSQICTTKEQSKRLIALGLKKETADMHHYRYSEGYWYIQACQPRGDSSSFIPAWSLGRLIKLMPKTIIIHSKEEPDTPYDRDLYAINILSSDDSIAEAVSTIEWLIKEEFFNKEYLI